MKKEDGGKMKMFERSENGDNTFDTEKKWTIVIWIFFNKIRIDENKMG